MWKWVLLVVVVLLISLLLFAQTSVPNAKQTVIKDRNLQVNPMLFCSDPSATLTISKSPTGVVTLYGKACNTGQGDYKGTQSLDAQFMVYTWHPPKTPAQEGDLKIFSHNAIGNNLLKGQCVPVTQTYTIPNFIRWEAPKTEPLHPGQRMANKQFVFRIEREYPLTVGFSKTEDCNNMNNGQSADISYVEKAP